MTDYTEYYKAVRKEAERSLIGMTYFTSIHPEDYRRQSLQLGIELSAIMAAVRKVEEVTND